MQLESTLFGVCVIPIRPLLERLMNVPSGSLVKEIALNERLLELLTQYQVPSDLLSYFGPEDAPVRSKLDYIEAQVAKLQAVVNAAKDAQLEEAQLAAKYRFNEDELRPHPEIYEPPPPSLPSPPSTPPPVSPRKKEKFFSNLVKRVAAPFKKTHHSDYSSVYARLHAMILFHIVLCPFIATIA